jgi:hypothetical protein
MLLIVVGVLTEVSVPSVILLIVAALTVLGRKALKDAVKHITPALVIDWDKLDSCFIQLFVAEIDGVKDELLLLYRLVC